MTRVLLVFGRGDYQPRGRMWEAIIDADLVVRIDPGLQSAVVIKDREHPTLHSAQILHAEDEETPMLDLANPERVASFLTFLEYPHDDVLRTVREKCNLPEGQAAQVVADAEASYALRQR